MQTWLASPLHVGQHRVWCLQVAVPVRSHRRRCYPNRLMLGLEALCREELEALRDP